MGVCACVWACVRVYGRVCVCVCLYPILGPLGKPKYQDPV